MLKCKEVISSFRGVISLRSFPEERRCWESRWGIRNCFKAIYDAKKHTGARWLLKYIVSCGIQIFPLKAWEGKNYWNWLNDIFHSKSSCVLAMDDNCRKQCFILCWNYNHNHNLFLKSLAQNYITVGLRILHKYRLEGPNLIFLKELRGLYLHFIKGEKVSPLLFPRPLQC